MSSGGVVLAAPLAVPVLVAAGAVVAVGGAAVLLVRAAGAATEAAAAGVEELGEAVEQAAQEQLDVQRSARVWELAAAEVVRLNARITVLTAAARRAGVAVDLPARLAPDCCQVAEIHQWCVAAESGLGAARERLDEAAAQQERTALLVADPAPAAAEVLARQQQRLSQRHAARPQVVELPPLEWRAEVERELEEWLGRLHVDATAAERQFLLRLAGIAGQQPDQGTAHTYVEQFTDEVKKTNTRAQHRQEAARWLEALEHPAVAAEPPPFPDIVRRLRAVVADDSALDPRLRADAQVCLRWAEGVVEDRYLGDRVREILETLGYRVESGLDVTHGPLRLVRSDWGDSHFAELRVESGQTKWRVVRRHGAVDAQSAALDREYCDDLIDDVEKAQERLQSSGLAVKRTTVTRVVDREARPADATSEITTTTAKQRYHDGPSS